MNNNHNLPRDLCAFRRQRILRRVLPCLALLLLLVGTLTLTKERIFREDQQSAVVIFYLAAGVLPFALTGVPHKLIDRTYWGIIEAIDVESSLDAGATSIRPRWKNKNTFLLTIRIDEGKIIRRRDISTTGKMEHKMDVYHVGDRVFHLYGSAHIVVFPTAAEHTLICPVCATLNTINRTACTDCEHTLVTE